MSKTIIEMEKKTEKEALWLQTKCNEMIKQFRAKNAAYGDSFGRSVRNYGSIAALTRMSDKWNRIESLILGAKNNVKDERLEDTLIDMACYCLMTAFELETEQSKEKEIKIEFRHNRTNPRCSNCKYAQVAIGKLSGDSYLECHLYPSNMKTTPNNACYHFESREEAN